MRWPLVSVRAYDLVVEDRDMWRKLYFEAASTLGKPVIQEKMDALARPDPEKAAIEKLNAEAIERGVHKMRDLYLASGIPVPDEATLRHEAASTFYRGGF